MKIKLMWCKWTLYSQQLNYFSFAFSFVSCSLLNGEEHFWITESEKEEPAGSVCVIVLTCGSQGWDANAVLSIDVHWRDSDFILGVGCQTLKLCSPLTSWKEHLQTQNHIQGHTEALREYREFYSDDAQPEAHKQTDTALSFTLLPGRLTPI